MLARHLAWYKLGLAIIFIMGIVPLGFLPSAAQAADPVDLVLGGEGATPWSISDIMPCFSGTKTVTLHNAGTASGMVFIWISDNVSGEGSNPESESGNTTAPGELDQYLLFNLTASGLNTNITLPTTIGNFPQSVSDTNYIKISPLNAGATVTLVWDWQLPCQTGNDVQGDNLTFSINYTLEELPSPAPPSGGGGGGGGLSAAFYACPVTLAINMQGNITTASMTRDGVLCKACLAKDGPGKNTLELDKDTKIILANNAVPLLIRVRASSVALPTAENIQVVGPVYEFNAYASATETTPSPVSISPSARLILTYDSDKLHQNTTEVFIANYDTQQGWMALAPVPGAVAEIGKAHGIVNHFSLFAVLARFEEPTTKFKVSQLTVSPSQIELNQEVAISLEVANTGTKNGDYSLVLTVDGAVKSTTQVTVAAGTSQTVNFTLTGDTAGKHQVKVNGLVGEFEVIKPAVPPVINWWLIGGITLLVLAIWAILGWRWFKDRKKVAPAPAKTPTDKSTE